MSQTLVRPVLIGASKTTRIVDIRYSNKVAGRIRHHKCPVCSKGFEGVRFVLSRMTKRRKYYHIQCAISKEFEIIE